jgi:hypothetical protein
VAWVLLGLSLVVEVVVVVQAMLLTALLVMGREDRPLLTGFRRAAATCLGAEFRCPFSSSFAILAALLRKVGLGQCSPSGWVEPLLLLPATLLTHVRASPCLGGLVELDTRAPASLTQAAFDATKTVNR